MGIARSDALRKMMSWRGQVEEHIAKVLANPGDFPHYLHEVRIWVRDIQRLKQHVGKKTGAQWDEMLAEWFTRLPEILGE